MLRAIARIDSPRSSASQMSARSASENRRVIATSQSIQLPLINQALRRSLEDAADSERAYKQPVVYEA